MQELQARLAANPSRSQQGVLQAQLQQAQREVARTSMDVSKWRTQHFAGVDNSTLHVAERQLGELGLELSRGRSVQVSSLEGRLDAHTFEHESSSSFYSSLDLLED